MLDRHNSIMYALYMELRVLKYFLTVAREGSITGAANSLHLGQKLLIRRKYKVSLTPEGMILRKRAQEIVEMVEKTEAEFSSLKNTLSGDIYIGCGETDSMKYIAQIIKEIQNNYPEIKFHIHSGNAEDVTEKLDRGLLDFGVLIQPIDLSKYDHIELPQKDIWGVVMRKDCPLAKKKYVELSDLKNLPLIASRQMSPKFSSESGFLDWFKDDFENLNITATYNLIFNAGIMVEAGIGYAITLDKLINTSGNLCFRPLKPKLESGLDIVWKKYQVFSPAAKLFLEKLKQHLN